MSQSYQNNAAFLKDLENWGHNVFELLMALQQLPQESALSEEPQDSKVRLLQQIQNQSVQQSQFFLKACKLALQEQEQELEQRLAASYQQQVFIPYIHVVQQFALNELEQQLVQLLMLPKTCVPFTQILQALHEQRQLSAAEGEWHPDLLAEYFQAREYSPTQLKTMLLNSSCLHHWCLIAHQASHKPSSGVNLDEIVQDFLLGLAAPKLFFGAPLQNLTTPDSPLFISDKSQQQLTDLATHCRQAENSSFLINFRGTDSLQLQQIASHWAAQFSLSLALFDVGQLSLAKHANDTATATRLRRLLRDGLLCNSGFLLDNCTNVAEDSDAANQLSAFLADITNSNRFSFVLNGNQRTLSEWAFNSASDVTLISLQIDSPDYPTRQKIWQCYGAQMQLPFTNPEYQQLASRYLFDQSQIVQTIKRYQGLLVTEQVSPWQNLLESCRQQTEKDMNSIATLVRNQYRFSDIVLPEPVQIQLQEVLNYAAHRHQIVEEWGFDKSNKQSRNLCSLFHGPSGTGKTMAASVIANELNQALYRVDLSSVMSKYIGETEKNLAQLFDKAEAMNVVLFFDEAESLFGKRTESKDSHDRYANLQTGYLLQRIEQYQGVVILSTNLLKNIDSAFIRRFKFVVEFPFPDAQQRLQIWKGTFSESAPVHTDVDLNLLSTTVKLTGGSINNIAVKAALYAAAEQQPVGMTQLLKAAEQEYIKQGKVFVADQYQWLDEEDIW